MRGRTIAEQAWNAALERIYDDGDLAYTQIEYLKAPSSEFDEWYEREVLNAPNSLDDRAS